MRLPRIEIRLRARFTLAKLRRISHDRDQHHRTVLFNGPFFASPASKSHLRVSPSSHFAFGRKPFSVSSVCFLVPDSGHVVPVIGLVGGVGSGKSSLARLLKQKHAVEIVDGDAAGHQVLKEDSVKQHIRTRFGDGG